MQSRQKVQQMLRKHVPNYNKDVDYRKYSGGYSEAVDRATRMDKEAENDGERGRNPTTSVYRLTELIGGQQQDYV